MHKLQGCMMQRPDIGCILQRNALVSFTARAQLCNFTVGWGYMHKLKEGAKNLQFCSRSYLCTVFKKTLCKRKIKINVAVCKEKSLKSHPMYNTPAIKLACAYDWVLREKRKTNVHIPSNWGILMIGYFD